MGDTIRRHFDARPFIPAEGQGQQLLGQRDLKKLREINERFFEKTVPEFSYADVVKGSKKKENLPDDLRLEISFPPDEPYEDLINGMAYYIQQHLNNSSDSKYKAELFEFASKLFYFMDQNEKDEFIDKGYKKLQKIRDTRPRDIEEYNETMQEKYNKRYITKIVPIKRKNRVDWIIETFVNKDGIKRYCYQNRLTLETGTFKFITDYKSRPPNDFYSLKNYPYGCGAFDDEVKIEGTEPLPNSAIAYMQMKHGLAFIKERYNIDTSQFDLKRIIQSNIVNRESANAMRVLLHFSYGDETLPERGSKTFPQGVREYYGISCVPSGAVNWYLVEHHFGNKNISAIKLYFTIDPHDGAVRYDLACFVENPADRLHLFAYNIGRNYSGHLSTCGASLDFSVEWSLVGMPAASQPDSTPQALRTAEGREESEEDT